MNPFEREYDVYLILGNPDLPPIWTWDRWLPVAALIDPLAAAARSRPAVKSFQLRPGPGSPNQRDVRFGRIGWNADGHRKWVHPTSGDSEGVGANDFESTEVWAPSWTTCEREEKMPDLFFAFRNEADLSEPPLQFNLSIVLAVAADQGAEVLANGQKAAEGLAEHVGAVLRAYQCRGWGKSLGGGGFTAAISEFMITGVFRIGPLHSAPPSFDLFTEQWRTF